jgi:beta-barrel assembly-enhancing protease
MMSKRGWMALLAAASMFTVSTVLAGELEDQLRKAIDPLKRLQKPKSEDNKAQQGQQPGNAQPSQPGADILPFGSVSTEDEVRIGSQIAGNLLGAAPLVKDQKLQEYVNKVGRWVALQSSRPDLKWTFGVIESADVNAFAAPGGYVFITRGLYAMLKDEAGLAGVLGHEIAHVQQKHHLKVLQQQQLIGVGSKLLGRQVGGNDQNVQRIIGSGAEIMARGLDKSAEFEADRIGVVLAARAGYDPWGLPEVLQEMGAIAKGSSSVALLFKTHPAPEERLTQLGDAMGEHLDALKDGRTLAERLYRGKSPARTADK